jgi:hypothetical protein
MSRNAENLNPGPYGGMPGYKEPTTSRDAACAVAPSAHTMCETVFEALKAAEPFGLTADEAAAKVGHKPGYIRPRLTELKLAGRVVKTEARRRNESGLSAAVWRIVP